MREMRSARLFLPKTYYIHMSSNPTPGCCISLVCLSLFFGHFTFSIFFDCFEFIRQFFQIFLEFQFYLSTILFSSWFFTVGECLLMLLFYPLILIHSLYNECFFPALFAILIWLNGVLILKLDGINFKSLFVEEC